MNVKYHFKLSSCTWQLLAEDPSLKRFKSHKKGVRRIKRIGDVLTIVVVAGCCYEIYVKAVMREEARKQAGERFGGSALFGVSKQVGLKKVINTI
ncbi:unnamed protein product [Thlaspi arvense]|uniref:Uncharacterized protein n=1 Tax=Thlaspi arvense TaxID=13288 RepID=A0AAU9RRW0_THLAR|nr:unnamed protein product [Thlaspi arvense]